MIHPIWVLCSSLVKLSCLDLDPLLKDISEETRTMILQAVQDSHQANLDKVRSWQSTMKTNFKTCYQVSYEVVNGIAENLRVYGKFVGALDLW